MSGNVTPYTKKITSEHRKTDFIAVITALCQPAADQQALLNSMPTLYDIDVAVGQQLDVVGEWVGVSRYLTIPLTGVYFSFDTSGLGFDEGTWHGPFDPSTTLDALPDDSYRVLLRARIANNQWDGTIPGAYEFMTPVFPGDTFFIQDHQDMTMLVGVAGSVPLNAVSYALLTNGYLDIKPAGVRIDGYATPSIPGDPMFGFDISNSLIGGFDTGCWATITGGS